MPRHLRSGILLILLILSKNRLPFFHVIDGSLLAQPSFT